MALNWYDYYLIFALATGIVIALMIALPVVREVQALGVDNSITRNPKLVIVVTFLYSAVLAPLFIGCVFVPDVGKILYNSMYKSFEKHD